MSIYGYCEDCKMELTSRDLKFAPPGICESCFGLDLYEGYNTRPNDYNQLSIIGLFRCEEPAKKEQEQS